VAVTTRLLTVLVALVMALVTGCGTEAPKLSRGEPPPPFTLERLASGEARFPSQFDGQIVAVRFWADWCPFCESEMQAIEPVYQRYRDQGLVILAINVRQDRGTAQDFIDKLNIAYDTLLDPEGDVARDYGVLGLPTTFLVDRSGRLHTRIIGESTPEVFEAIVLELL
jgi:cytochrome c biogenesis protein CcmG/thiol:disulfide interchange protein DsbE